MLLLGMLPISPKGKFARKKERGFTCSVLVFQRSVLLACGTHGIRSSKSVVNWSPMELPCRKNLHSSAQTAYSALCCRRMFVGCRPLIARKVNRERDTLQPRRLMKFSLSSISSISPDSVKLLNLVMADEEVSLRQPCHLCSDRDRHILK